jgi:hypothetical protein
MDCVRTSFEETSIFKQGTHIHLALYFILLMRRSVTQDDQMMLRRVMVDILRQDDPPVIRTPFHINLASASTYLVQWLVEGTNQSSFSVAGLLRSTVFSNMLHEALGAGISDHFRLMVYLCSDLAIKDDTSTYHGYTAAELHTAGHYAGNVVLRMVDQRLRPARLEQARNKLDELRALLLTVFGISITAKYMYLNVR